MRCPGIEVRGWKSTALYGSNREPAPSLCTYEFKPFIDPQYDEQFLNPILQAMSVIMSNTRYLQILKPIDVIEFTSTPETLEALKTCQFMRVDWAAPELSFKILSFLQNVF